MLGFLPPLCCCCRGRGQVVAAACACDVIVLATSRGYLLRYQWDEYGNEKGESTARGVTSQGLQERHQHMFSLAAVGTLSRTSLFHADVGSRMGNHPMHVVLLVPNLCCAALYRPVLCAVVEVELTRQSDNRVRGLYLDPTGVHTIACLKSSSSSSHEVLYHHSSWMKPRTLSKLKGVAVSAVGWQRQPVTLATAAVAGADGRPGSAGSSMGGKSGGDDEQLLLHTTG